MEIDLNAAAPSASHVALPRSALERAAAGDEVAFTRVVAAYHADLLRVAYVVCGDRDMAEDAVQQAWTIAWRKLASVRDPDRVRSWLVAVAANEARQIVRRSRRRAVVEVSVAGENRPNSEPTDAIRRVDLVNALSALRPDDRALLAMRYVIGLDSQEIAQLNGMSASGTRARLARLLRRLRGELRDA